MSQTTRRSTRRFGAIVAAQQQDAMRPVLLWLLGIPTPIIILLYVFHVG